MHKTFSVALFALCATMFTTASADEGCLGGAELRDGPMLHQPCTTETGEAGVWLHALEFMTEGAPLEDGTCSGDEAYLGQYLACAPPEQAL